MLICYKRPESYNNVEFISFIYYLQYGFSSIIKERKAPDSFINRYKNKIKETDDHVSYEIMVDMIKYLT